MKSSCYVWTGDYLYFPFSIFSITVMHLPVFFIPLITTPFLISCHPFALPTETTSNSILFHRKTQPYATHLSYPQSALVLFSFLREDFSAHREALNKDYRYPSLPQSLQSVGNFYLLHAEVKTLITALWDLAIQGKTCSLDMVINPHLEEVRRGKKRNSNFNCGHFKNRISSHMYFMVRVAV